MKQTVIRPTATIKNPFFAFNDEHARISTIQAYPLDTFQSAKEKRPRCETEAAPFKTPYNKPVCYFTTNQENNDDEDDGRYRELYFKEVTKHESTKRALDKAI
jgi:hypothetical protein